MIPKIGLILNGFCNGYFGRASYGPKCVEGFGVDWVVVREADGSLGLARFETSEIMETYLDLWSKHKSEPEVDLCGHLKYPDGKRG